MQAWTLLGKWWRWTQVPCLYDKAKQGCHLVHVLFVFPICRVCFLEIACQYATEQSLWTGAQLVDP